MKTGGGILSSKGSPAVNGNDQKIRFLVPEILTYFERNGEIRLSLQLLYVGKYRLDDTQFEKI